MAIGVIHNQRKYRFSTIGIASKVIERIQELEKRLQDLKMIVPEKESLKVKQMNLGI